MNNLASNANVQAAQIGIVPKEPGMQEKAISIANFLSEAEEILTAVTRSLVDHSLEIPPALAVPDFTDVNERLANISWRMANLVGNLKTLNSRL